MSLSTRVPHVLPLLWHMLGLWPLNGKTMVSILGLPVGTLLPLSNWSSCSPVERALTRGWEEIQKCSHICLTSAQHLPHWGTGSLGGCSVGGCLPHTESSSEGDATSSITEVESSYFHSLIHIQSLHRLCKLFPFTSKKNFWISDLFKVHFLNKTVLNVWQ